MTRRRRPKPARIRVRTRLHRCYELAGKGAFKDGSWKLVHWVLSGSESDTPGWGWAYDPVRNECVPEAVYMAEYEATVERCYTQQQGRHG
jgi:hypothetical protein